MNARPVAAEQGFVFPETIPSAVTYAEAVRLHTEAKGKIVLEMGAQFGLSTIVLAQAARHVVSVDWHRGDQQAGLIDTLAGYWLNLKQHGVDHKVTVIADRFDSALSYLKPGCFDLVFIDGCHDEEAVQADIELALPLLRRPGTMLFHDYGRAKFPGVRKQVDRLADRNLSLVHGTGTVAGVTITRA